MGCVYMDHEEKGRAKMAPRFLAHKTGEWRCHKLACSCLQGATNYVKPPKHWCSSKSHSPQEVFFRSFPQLLCWDTPTSTFMCSGKSPQSSQVIICAFFLLSEKTVHTSPFNSYWNVFNFLVKDLFSHSTLNSRGRMVFYDSWWIIKKKFNQI